MLGANPKAQVLRAEMTSLREILMVGITELEKGWKKEELFLSFLKWNKRMV